MLTTKKRFNAIGDITHFRKHCRMKMTRTVYSALRTLFIFLVLASVVSPLRAFEFKEPFPSGDYPFTVKDSGVEVVVDKPVVVEWLDEERVIFSALNPGQARVHGKPKPDQASYVSRVMVWNTRTGELKEHSPGRLYCAYRGFVSMAYSPESSTAGKPLIRSRSGLFGHEEDKAAWKQGDPPLHRDIHTCKIYQGAAFNPEPTHELLPLREEDGVLDTGGKGTSRQGRPVLIVRPDGTRTELPIKAIEVQGVWWNDWAGVYLLAHHRYGGILVPREPDTLPILYPDGRLERYALPQAYWSRNVTSRAVLTKRGLFVANDSGTELTKGGSGAYLIRGDQISRLIDWYVGNKNSASEGRHIGIALSPSGCKVAFKHGAVSQYKNPHTIKMIDLCEGE